MVRIVQSLVLRVVSCGAIISSIQLPVTVSQYHFGILKLSLEDCVIAYCTESDQLYGLSLLKDTQFP